MKQWTSGAFQLGAILLALLAPLQWPTLASAGSGRDALHVQQAADNDPARLGWMLEQHWQVVNGLK